MKILWDFLKINAIKTDRRYKDLIPKIEEYILDFHEIDPNGQTFRYPDDNFKTPHLRKTPLINVLKFYKRFFKACILLKKLVNLNNTLVEEYSVKTHTKSLSRFDIESISKKIPCRTEWTKDIFSKKKSEILSEYNLSSKEFSKALNVIQNHRLFCNNIGIELPLKITNSAKILKFMDEVDSYYKPHTKPKNKSKPPLVYSFDSVNFLRESELYSAYIKKMILLIRNDIGLRHFADITAIYDLGRLPIYYGELYEQRLHTRLKKIIKIWLYHPEDIDNEILYYINKSNLRTGIIEGLKMIGKHSIINELQKKKIA